MASYDWSLRLSEVSMLGERKSIGRVVLGLFFVAVVGAGCGAGADPVATTFAAVAPNPECAPDEGVAGIPPSNPDRRIEDIIEAMTGERQTGDLDPVEETITDPNFGGVYGDFRGGVVVAVLDCSKIDVNELARIAGGAGYIHFVEVPHTFSEVDGFRDALVAELRATDVHGDVLVESTLSGRHIEVRVQDISELPGGFAATVPSDAFTIIETDDLFQEE